MTQVVVLCQELFIYPGNIKTLRDPSGRANRILVVMFKEATMTDTNLADVTVFVHGRLHSKQAAGAISRLWPFSLF